jgi:exopolyphosphatase/guanosine-5'-triphosphate,3'-diphosphate pyrophosphatase
LNSRIREVKRAVIDIGTNSVLLLIGSMKDGKIRDVVQEFKVTRLGEDLLSTGNLSQQAMARTIKVLSEYRDIITKNNIQRVDLVGTESLRLAGNRDEFLSRLEQGPWLVLQDHNRRR